MREAMSRVTTWVGAGAMMLSALAMVSATLVSARAPARAVAAHLANTEWRGVNGDSDETGFSPLSQINAANARGLGLAWSLELPGEVSLQASPIAIGDMLYFTGSNASVYAVQAVTGKIAWKFDPKTWQERPAKLGNNFASNRGVAYDKGRIFSAAVDGRLFALDAKSGRKLWEVETTDYSITGAPRVFDGKVIIGQGGADLGARGYVTAYDQATGKQVWRFYVVPASPEENAGNPAMEAAAKTWDGPFWKKNGGGGGPWDSMTFDAEMGRIYVGTANAYEYEADARSPGKGDNLYTASIVALDARTGKYLWHYQVNPRDSWDYDCTQQITLATLTIDGRPRKVLMQAPKNGFFYVIDRESGRLISANNYAKVNWADGIDVATGRPVERANIRYETGESVIFPFTSGAHSWMRMAFSPKSGLVYIPYMQAGTRFSKGQPDETQLNIAGLNVGNRVSASDPDDGKGALVAWDPVTQKERWRVRFGTLWNGGTLATAGDVVFMGTADGWFSAFDAGSGKRLWRSWAGMGIIAAPATYSVGGRQYVSILAGYGGSAAVNSDIMNVGWKYSGPRRLLTFALGGKARLPKSPALTLKIDPVVVPDEKLDPAKVAMGRAMFLACAACHGRNAVGAGGPAPDLRESAIVADPDAYWSVLHDGVLMDRGMPKIPYFQREQAEAIRQFIRSRAQVAATASKD